MYVNQTPGVFDSDMVIEQLRNSGLFQTIEIRRSGFCFRAPHAAFVTRYSPAVPDMLDKKNRGHDHKASSKKILNYIKDIPTDGWQVGKTKVFMREQYRSILERRRAAGLEEFVVLIQRIIRGYLARVVAKELREERERRWAEAIQSCKDKILAAMKEENLFALEGAMQSVKDLGEIVRPGSELDRLSLQAYELHVKLQHREEIRVNLLNVCTKGSSDIPGMEAAITQARDAGVNAAL